MLRTKGFVLPLNLSSSSCPSINGYFAQSLRQAQISILKILNVFLRLKSSPSLILNKLSQLWMDTISDFT